MNPSLLRLESKGLYSEEGNFYIDPWKAVPKALITHAHADHARAGSESYLCSASGHSVLKKRVQEGAVIESVYFGKSIQVNSVKVTFFPAGHILGSAQILIEGLGERIVVTGDYKRELDCSGEQFEPVRCDTLITESTFGLPIFNWEDDHTVFSEMSRWWEENQKNNKTSVIFAYSLGKAQRVLSGVSHLGPIAVHGAVAKFIDDYRAAGVSIPNCLGGDQASVKEIKGKGLVVAPPSALNTPWLRKYGPMETSFASGWMRVRGNRRRKGVSRGFVLSDHVDWNGLLETVKDSQASEVLVTHGYRESVAKYLRETGVSAASLESNYTGEPES